MLSSHEIVLRGGRLIDPANGIDGRYDIGICDGVVAEVAEQISTTTARVIDVDGKLVVPGLIDMHVHLSSEFNGAVGHAMLARAGVTTALDVAGPVGDVLTVAARHGVGLSVACLDRVRPGETVPDESPDSRQVREAIDRAVASGAIGVKVLGGHFPLTPDATADVIEIANRQRVYVALHAGTTDTSSDLKGLEEAIVLAGSNRLHIAHVNAYCRGGVAEPATEALAAVDLLREAPHCFSESYLATINGTWADCVDGVPISQRTRQCLLQAGYAATAHGLEGAIIAGVAMVHVVAGDDIHLQGGHSGAEYWKSRASRAAVSFMVNPAAPRLVLAFSKDSNGQFDVDALATDGGGIPRNDVIANGFRLVKLGALTLSEWVMKSSCVPARVLGLKNKGQLAVGADADIAVIDPRTHAAVTTIASGKVVMYEGLVIGNGATWLGLAGSERRVTTAGCEFKELDPESWGFFTGHGLKA